MILIADDDVGWRELLRQSLEADGFTVLEAGDGDQAIEILKRNPNVKGIAIDLLLPGLNGYEVATKIRSDPAVATVPIVFMSGLKPDEASFVAPLALGAFDVIDKGQGAKSIAGAIRIAVNATHAVEGGLR